MDKLWRVLMDKAGDGTEGGAGGAAAGDGGAAGAGASAGKGADGAGAGAGTSDGKAAGAGDGKEAGAGSGDGGASAVKPDWPADWVKLASPDEKVQERLSRYASPKAMAEALIAAQDKIRSGELKPRTEFPIKGTVDEQAKWREDNGVPAAPDRYDLTFDNGLVIGEEDKPIIDSFLKAAHEANVPMGAAKTAIGWYFKTIEERTQAQLKQNADAKEATENALRAEWGGEFAGLRNRIKTLVQTASPEVADKILDARFPDGTAVFNDANFMRWMGQIAKIMVPSSTIIPGDQAAIAAQVDDRLAEIKEWMAAPATSPKGKKYWKDPKVQEEYRRLLDHQAASQPKK